MSAPTDTARVEAPVIEVFGSIQGEGLFVGEPQVFVRLRGCPLRCRWCDTPGSWTLTGRESARIAGPIARHEPLFATPFQVACWIAEVENGAPRSVSLTGGEPLVWPAFVRGLRAVLGPRRLHLETAGAHPRALAQVLESVDHVSFDLKAPLDLDPPVELEPSASERAPHGAEAWREVRREVLRLLRDRDACAKLIVSGEREAGELEELVHDLAQLAREIPLVIQPVTPQAGVRAPEPQRLLELAELALELGLTVRVLPQVHKQLRLP